MESNAHGALDVRFTALILFTEVRGFQKPNSQPMQQEWRRRWETALIAILFNYFNA
ncbi:MAG: hypothetical protein LCH38_09235 [Proteobacteria bacterium]|nr:hypothetical protein [Pseudomonadota bacterium]